MSNDGGRANEPTSYGLRPPDAPPPQSHQVPPQNPYAAPVNPYQQPPAHQSPAGQQPVRQSPAHAQQQPAHRPTEVSAPPPGAAAPQDPDAGRVVGGRYRLVERLGHGGMGTVWRAHDEIVDRDVAVKEPRVPDHLGERERQTVYQRMQREARAAARIDHPSVVTVHDVVVEDGRPWIVMELVRGHSLADRLEEGTLDPREAARIGLAVVGALGAAHEAGVLHRDVKPANVLLGRVGTYHDDTGGGERVVLTDFGIAQVEGEQGLTETGAFVGSPEYIAPERVLGQRPGPESDLWSLGVVLYASVEGMSPYRRSNTPATLQAVLSAEPQIPARASGPLGHIVMQLLRKEPALRPPVAEIRQALEAVARPAPPSLAATQLVARGQRAAGGSRWVPPVLHRNRPAQYGLGAGVFTVALALVLLIAQPFKGEEMPADWVVREESEVVGADIAVPRDYKRVPGSDDGSVTFNDPSGVFTVYLTRVVPGEDDDPLEAVGPEADEWVEYYEAGGDNGTDIQDVESKVVEARQQGTEARDIITSLREYAASEDDIYYRWHERLVVSDDKKAYWRLRVTMPHEGDAAEDGEKLFAEVVKYLEIKDL
ncbi:serine/threonine-protein kinase [Streptomyces sp. GC420]|uniref:serine/threonine-protein kinase n=1 Tax=Streptomyces sp. GC420 TaxID=2697568 RepID=UPI0014150B35|nr:serine/threonine-protein kinase [Streptomyces sp. GC420]NBM19265.1 protein kinase [Streptomyces sp. GC420]